MTPEVNAHAGSVELLDHLATDDAVAPNGHPGMELTSPQDVLCEIANRASNMGDPDAIEWMPSIYKLACDAIGSDPLPLLKALGFDGPIKDWPTRRLAATLPAPVAWRWYQNGVIVDVTEEYARHVFDRWGVLSDERGAALLMIEQLWAEIDRLRAAPVAQSPVGGEREEVLRLLKKISDLAYDEDVGEPLDDAIGYANKAIAALSRRVEARPVTTEQLDRLQFGRVLHERATPPVPLSTGGGEESFDITWKNGAYYVSIPNYQGGKVYTADYVERLRASPSSPSSGQAETTPMTRSNQK